MFTNRDFAVGNATQALTSESLAAALAVLGYGKKRKSHNIPTTLIRTDNGFCLKSKWGESRFDKHGNPTRKHELRHIKRLDMSRISSTILANGIEITLTHRINQCT